MRQSCRLELYGAGEEHRVAPLQAVGRKGDRPSVGKTTPAEDAAKRDIVEREPAWRTPIPGPTPRGKEMIAMEVAIAIQAIALLFALLVISQRR